MYSVGRTERGGQLRWHQRAGDLRVITSAEEVMFTSAVCLYVIIIIITTFICSTKYKNNDKIQVMQVKS